MHRRTFTHERAPAYKVGGKEQKPHLRAKAYQLVNLAYCTIGSFYKIPISHLTLEQVHARRHFMYLFEQYATRDINTIPGDELVSALWRMGKYIDEFFFFGSLTRRLQITLMDSLPSGFERGRSYSGGGEWGSCTWEVELARRKRAHRGPCTCIRTWSLVELVSTLAHEMIHGFFHMFACRCVACRMDDVEGHGLTIGFHGRVFLVFSAAVVEQMAIWLDAFRDELHSDDFLCLMRNYRMARKRSAQQVEGKRSGNGSGWKG
ncbi:hypothetical protein GGS20DRAFT_327083 [Poronia punctata]|nr:hypothetical protein GGS20DRAFT_327083 [Poronia punctata]